jgi:hypothetical protein
MKWLLTVPPLKLLQLNNYLSWFLAFVICVPTCGAWLFRFPFGDVGPIIALCCEFLADSWRPRPLFFINIPSFYVY